MEERHLILLLFRSVSARWSVRKLSAALRIPPRTLRLYEKGEIEPPPWAFLFEAALAMGLPLYAVHEHRALAHQMLRTSAAEPFPSGDPDLWEGGAEIARSAVQEFGGEVRLKLKAPLHRKWRRDDGREEKWRLERERAGEAWESLRGFSPQQWQTLPAGGRSPITWAMVERFCHESARLVSRIRPEERKRDLEVTVAAEGLANLALRTACLLLDEEPWTRDPLREYAWAHVGHVRRACGNPLGAEEAFFYADEHYFRGWATDGGPLDASRPFVLKALLRRDQRCFDDALGLLLLAQPLLPAEDRSLDSLVEEIDLLKAKHGQRGEVAELREAIGETMAGAVGRLERKESFAEERQRLRSLLPRYEAAGGLPEVSKAAALFLKMSDDDRLSLEMAHLLWQSFLFLESATTAPYESVRRALSAPSERKA